MKKQNPTLHDKTNHNASAPAGNPALRHTFKLGLDVDLRTIVTAIQCDRGAIQLPQKFSRAQLLTWVREKIAAGHQVHIVYEACGFGYTLYHELLAADLGFDHSPVPFLVRNDAFSGAKEAVANFIAVTQILCIGRNHLVQVIHTLDDFCDERGLYAGRIQPFRETAVREAGVEGL